ncbi:pyridoxal-phosphate dependent enzyme [Candidatus Sumerlaeota bacterium]|nr:pyridoxal-phosphate dependent enzyme [Candidatus Sumerlaeota bacterium]
MHDGDIRMTLRENLFRSILLARQRVYEFGSETPLEEIEYNGIHLFLKREDASLIHAYKWRGACNRMALLSAEERARGVICASAGNHAQGVAWAAAQLGINAKIYMPEVAPRMKVLAVRRIGEGHVEIIIHGDTFEAAAREARRVQKIENRVFIHAYDDLETMAGQGTLADEIVMSGKGPMDVAYVQIGGGGMAAGVACWLKNFWPNIRIVGVEGEHQASMAAAIRAGKPVDLEYVDVFADGTAVSRAGDLTYPLCAELIDELITVTNEEICAAVQMLWEESRCLPEPAGAMGIAGMLKHREQLRGKKVIAIVCGANMDFGQLAYISRHAGIGAATRQYYRFQIAEAKGTFLRLIEATRGEGVNIIEFQYGKIEESRSFPVIGFEASPQVFALLEKRAEDLGIPCRRVTGAEDVEFRIIHYDPGTFRRPFFMKFEFPERAGALRDFLRAVQHVGSMVYCNYVYTGERVGHALMGFEFDSEVDREAFIRILQDYGTQWKELPPEILSRIL